MDAADVERAVDEGELEETHTFDAKRLPGKNRDIAIDVCAMTVNGGALLYGVGEDTDKRLTVLAPIDLAGVPERIDQIVATSISEPPTIRVTTFPKGDAPSTGYLLVVVPASPRAPHMVIVRNEMRFYGRGAVGNRTLAEAEVAQLYARRERWNIDRDEHLAAVLDDHRDHTHFGKPEMHAFARPVGFDPGYLRRAWVEEQQDLRDALVRAAETVSVRGNYAPDLRIERGWTLHGADGIAIGDFDRRRPIRMTIRHDGEARLFATCGRRLDESGDAVIFEHSIAGNLASFFAIAGAFYARAGYTSSLDVGVALTGVGGVSAHLVRMNGEERPFPQRDYRQTDRVLVGQAHKAPAQLAMQLTRLFYDAIVKMAFEPLLA